MHRLIRALVAVVLSAAAVASAGCGAPAEDSPALEPSIEPPVVMTAGVLTVGIDTTYPPFASVEGDEVVGIDADVAAAIAEALGLRVEFVELGPGEAAQALIDGDVDIALGAIPISEAVLTDVSFAGSYLADGPAFLSATETTEGASSLYGKAMGAQDGSAAYWDLQALYGEGVVTGYETLREAVAAADSGELDLVAGDAVVAAYVARDYPAVRFLAQIGDAVPLGVAVAKEADDLESAVREALDGLASDGVLEAIRAKWVGSLPDLATPSAETSPPSG